MPSTDSCLETIPVGPIRGVTGEYRVADLSLQARMQHALAQENHRHENRVADIRRYYERLAARPK